MFPPPSTPSRRLIHRRAIDVQIFARDDQLYDVEARLVDTKTQDMALAGGVRPAGEPIHDMLLSLVVDAHLTILEANSRTLGMPYPGTCDQHGDVYKKLVGLNLLHGFRLGVKDRVGGVKACTHLTELCQILPTAVIQAFAGVVIDTQEGRADGSAPFQIDRCHALRRDGEIVQTHYPRWYRKSAEVATATEPLATPASSF
ncbi:DUF2889 domain-containing protein [Roseateles koreensis]|uniref:DUF2889 domain-containing protein n=1 Tax=Roseateles koreensis TaxID=2987526 RepID=A0ABT5KRT0_9BURK|nr:DUF2889 domain-containing protein [Roseateles koreensis]MDC8785642.1 DUF2889 domain-containing protein [Roseateles koreensis]